MANWITQGDPGMDLWPFDIRRFSSQQANRHYLAERSSEAYGNYYAIHWPVEELASARGAKRSPLHEVLKARGAQHGSKAGWERPNWFLRPGSDASERPSFMDKAGWFDAVADEHRAVRERVALIDLTSFSKFEVSGPNALAGLQRIAANDLDRRVGACTYTQCCNERGGIEADLTVMRLDSDRFYIVTGSQFGTRDEAWLRRHLPQDVQLREVTGALAVINLVGPQARAVLEQVTDDDVSDQALPYLSGKNIEIGLGRAFTARVGYVGDLGYELHVPVEYAAHVYERLRTVGEPLGIADVGYRAMESLRLEKGYVYWSSEVTPDVDPYAAGLGFAVALDKGPFIGRDALRRIKEAGPKRRLVTLAVEGWAPLIGSEAVLVDRQAVGTTTSAGYGHTVGQTIAFAFVPADLPKQATFAIEAYGVAWPAVRGPRSLYDPRGLRAEGCEAGDGRRS